MNKFKRNFGREENTPSSSASGGRARCTRCGETLCSLPVFIRVEPDRPAQTVCYKIFCVRCGAIHVWNGTDKNGQPETRPAFFAYRANGGGILTAERNLFLPSELYARPDGIADVGLKVRLVRALLRLQLARPKEREFSAKEVFAEASRDTSGR